MPLPSYWCSIDLSSRAPGLSLHVGAKNGLQPVAEAHAEKRGGLEWFLPAFQGLLESQKISVSQVSHWILPNGPGSFTGLRIGVASVKGFLTVTPGDVTLIDSLEARWLGLGERGARAHVVHRLSKDQYAAGTQAAGKWQTELLTPEEVKARSATNRIFFEDVTEVLWEGAELFPLTAKHLAAALANSQTAKTYASATEWQKLQPQYWGDTRFGTPA